MTITRRPAMRPDGVPSRCDLTLMSPAELAITTAMQAVEAAGCSVALTEAVTLLQQARERVADHVEAPPPTVAELDAILNSEGDTPIVINPDGTIRAVA